LCPLQDLREADVRYAEWLPPGHNDEEDAKELSTILEGETSLTSCLKSKDCQHFADLSMEHFR
jgi:hypothetical protein